MGRLCLDAGSAVAATECAMIVQTARSIRRVECLCFYRVRLWRGMLGAAPIAGVRS